MECWKTKPVRRTVDACFFTVFLDSLKNPRISVYFFAIIWSQNPLLQTYNIHIYYDGLANQNPWIQLFILFIYPCFKRVDYEKLSGNLIQKLCSNSYYSNTSQVFQSLRPYQGSNHLVYKGYPVKYFIFRKIIAFVDVPCESVYWTYLYWKHWVLLIENRGTKTKGYCQ